MYMKVHVLKVLLEITISAKRLFNLKPGILMSHYLTLNQPFMINYLCF